MKLAFKSLLDKEVQTVLSVNIYESTLLNRLCRGADYGDDDDHYSISTSSVLILIIFWLMHYFYAPGELF